MLHAEIPAAVTLAIVHEGTLCKLTQLLGVTGSLLQQRSPATGFKDGLILNLAVSKA